MDIIISSLKEDLMLLRTYIEGTLTEQQLLLENMTQELTSLRMIISELYDERDKWSSDSESEDYESDEVETTPTHRLGYDLNF